MTVSVKVEQGTITGLTIENAEDDQTYLDRAKSGIFSEIMKKQSAEEIDTVSGATYSSKGLIEATQNALKEAAGDENTVQENTASESTDTTEEKQAFLDAGLHAFQAFDGKRARNRRIHQREAVAATLEMVVPQK